MKDKQEVGSRKIPYIWLYKGFLTLDDGVNYWLNYLKRRNFLSEAKQGAEAFVDALRRGRYAGSVLDPNTKKVDEVATKAKYQTYLNGVAGVANDSKIQGAIARNVNEMVVPENKATDDTRNVLA
jgi:hypothetical protein